MERGTSGGWRVATRGLAGLMLALLGLPPLALLLATRPADLAGAVEHGLWEALWLSLWTTSATAALLLALGTPLAWVLSRREGRAGRLLELLVQLPAVTPPAVAGVALLAAFGRGSLLGAALDARGLAIAFSPAAVVLAQLFVATPFYALPLAQAFRDLDEDLLWTARSLGAGPRRVFFRIALPMVAPALLSALATAWARALGEFGATLVFAGSLEGVTRTLPTAIVTAMERDLGAARALALGLMALALLVFLALRGGRVLGGLGPGGTPHGARG